MTELTGLTVAESVGVESDRTKWTNSGRTVTCWAELVGEWEIE